jgi:hypothetical protein
MLNQGGVITSSMPKMFQRHGRQRVCSSLLPWFQAEFRPEFGRCSNGLEWEFDLLLWIGAELIFLSLLERTTRLVWVI